MRDHQTVEKIVAFPVNRKQSFCFIYRYQWMKVMQLSFLVFLFAIPFFFANISIGIVLNSILSKQEINEEILAQYYANKMVYSTLYLPSIFLLLFAGGSAIFVFKKMCWNEPFRVVKDFFSSMKKNAKELSLVSLFYTILTFFIIFSMSYLSRMFLSFYLVFEVIKLLLLLLEGMMMMYSFTMISIYKNSLAKTIKNSFFFTCFLLPKNFGMLLLTIFPLVFVSLVNLMILSSVVMLLYACIGFGNAMLMIFLFCNSIYDQKINEKQFPEIYHMGLFDPEEEE